MENFVWITGGDKSYMGMVKILAESLLKFSKYKLIVYGFNCDVDIDLPNVIQKRVNFAPKNTHHFSYEPDLINKDYSLYYGKYIASLYSFEENFEKFAWLDGDAFVTENIDNSLKLFNDLPYYPLFMRYYHPDVAQWKLHGQIKLEGKYGMELSTLKNIQRNPFNRILATGFYFYDRKSKWFFEKCMEWYSELSNRSMRIFVDTNAFSEERTANCILWQHNQNQYLPVTWNNYYSSPEETKVNNYFLKKGFDIMYNENTLEPYFIHGPDPHIIKKSPEILKSTYNDYICTKLMIVAHPDDETIFGGIELAQYGPEYKVVCLTNSSNELRKKEFNKAMRSLKVRSWEMWDWKDDLYNFTDLDIKKIKTLINSRTWEKIVTHNPIGEYGHPQHKAVFDAVKSITDNFYVFGKSTKNDIKLLNKKVKALNFYLSEKDIIQQLLTKNGDWFKSNDNSTNYIEHESIEKYNPEKDITPYIACYDK